MTIIRDRIMIKINVPNFTHNGSWIILDKGKIGMRPQVVVGYKVSKN